MPSLPIVSFETHSDENDEFGQSTEPREFVDPLQDFIQAQHKTLLSDNNDETPARIPDHKLFSPSAVVIAGLIASPLIVTGLLIGINYQRLGLRRQAFLAFFCSVMSCFFLFCLAIAFPAAVPLSGLAIPLLFVAYFAVRLLQGKHISAHDKAGGLFESNWKAAGIAVLTFGSVYAIGAAWDSSQSSSFGTRLAVGQDDEIYYSGGVTVEEARQLGAFLKSENLFDDTTPQTAVLSQKGSTVLISFFIAARDTDDPKLLQSYQEDSATFSGELFNARPVQILLYDESCRFHRRLTPVASVSKKTWQTHVDAATKAFDEERYGAAEVAYREAVQEAETHESLKKQLVWSLNNVGNCRLCQNLTDDVEPHFQRALILASSSLGEKSYEAGYAVNGLARWEWERGNSNEAVELFRRALAIRETLGSDHREGHLDTLQSLVTLLMAQNDFVDAEVYQQQRVSLIENHPESEPREIARELRLLAKLTWQLEKYPESQKLYKRAVQVLERIRPPPYEEYLSNLIVAGQADQILGDYDSAETHFRRAISLQEGRPEPDELLRARLSESLATLLVDRARYQEAESLYRQSLELREWSLGKDHVDVGDTLSHLGSLEMELGRFEDAKRDLKRGIEIFEQAKESDPERLADCLHQFAELHCKLQRFSEAERSYRRALSIREEVLGKEHEKVAATVSALSSLFCDRGDYSTAESFARRALQMAESRFGTEHPLTVESLLRLARVLSGQQKFTSAEEVYRRALDIGTRAFDKEDPYLAKIKNGVAVALLEQDRYAEAKPFLEQALKTYEEVLGPAHPNLIGPLNNLGLTYHESDEIVTAGQLFERALRLAEELFGKNHPDILPILTNYAKTLRALKQSDKAQGLEKRAEEIRAKQTPEIRLPAGQFVG